MAINNYDSSTVRSGTYRKDTPVALAANDGDTQPLITDSSGKLYVSASFTPSGTQDVNLAQVAGNPTVTGGAVGLLAVGGPVGSGSTNADNPIKVGGPFNTTQPTVTNGQVVDGQYTARGASIVATGIDQFSTNTAQIAGSTIATAGTGIAKVGVTDGTGTAITSTSSALDVNIKSGTLTGNQNVNLAQVAGNNTVTGGVNGLLAVAGPVASGGTNADNPLKVGGVFNTTQPTVTNGQVVDLQATSRGAAIVATGTDTFTVSVSSVPSNQSVNLSQIGANTVVTAGVNGTLAVGGNVATNVAIGTNPINLGAQGVSSENTVVTTSRMAQLVSDLVGKLIVLPYANPENFISGSTGNIVDTTSTAIIAAQAAGVRSYITQIIVNNSHATVNTWVNIKDGSTTLYTVYALAAGGGATITLPTPLRGSTATALNAVCETTGSNVRVSASGYKGA